MHLLAKRFVFFLGRDHGFLKEVVKTYQMAAMSTMYSATLYFCLHVYYSL